MALFEVARVVWPFAVLGAFGMAYLSWARVESCRRQQRRDALLQRLERTGKVGRW